VGFHYLNNVLRLIFNALDTAPVLLLLGYAFVRGQIEWRRDYIFWFVLTQAVLNSLATITQLLDVNNNLYLYHLNCAFSFLILSVYFGDVLRLKNIRLITLVVMVGFFLFYTINLLRWENLQTFNSNSFGLASLIIVVYCFLYYLDKLIHPATQNIARSSNFWFVTGLFTYYASSFFIFITFRTLIQNRVINLGVLWRIHNGVFLLMCIYILIGMICKPLPKKSRL
jgi:hypothetical protein